MEGLIDGQSTASSDLFTFVSYHIQLTNAIVRIRLDSAFLFSSNEGWGETTVQCEGLQVIIVSEIMKLRFALILLLRVVFKNNFITWLKNWRDLKHNLEEFMLSSAFVISKPFPRSSFCTHSWYLTRVAISHHTRFCQIWQVAWPKRSSQLGQIQCIHKNNSNQGHLDSRCGLVDVIKLKPIIVLSFRS